MVPSGPPLIREAREDDLPRLLILLHQLAAGGSTPEAAVPALTDQHRAALQALMLDPRYHVLVLEDGGQVQGTCVLYVLPNLSHGGAPWGLVENVVVDDAMRSRGFGALLMAEAVRRADAAGCYRVSLMSNARRLDAHRFYERIGFHNTHKGFTRYR